VTAFRCGINEVLLTGLVLAVTRWCRERCRGSAAGVLVDLEGHGREGGFPDIELSRTVGWFTSLFPLRLGAAAVELDEALTGGPAWGVALKRIKEQLRTVPDHGIGYGLLRHLNAHTGAELARFDAPQLCFNYLGRFDPGSEPWGLADEGDTVGG